MAGLSGDEESAVKASWTAIEKDWDSSLGAAFLKKLFRSFPEIYKEFPYRACTMEELDSNDRFKGHVVNFGKTLAGLVGCLSDGATLTTHIEKLVDDHIARKITSMTEFNKAFDCLLQFIKDGTSPSDATAAAWKKTFAAVSGAMEADFKKKGK